MSNYAKHTSNLCQIFKTSDCLEISSIRPNNQRSLKRTLTSKECPKPRFYEVFPRKIYDMTH